MKANGKKQAIGILAVVGTMLTVGCSSSPKVDETPVPMADTRTEFFEEDFIQNARRITLEGRRAGEGYFSPDGRYMTFQSERETGNPFYQIYLLDFETGETSLVSTGVGRTTCSWIQADTGNVLFASTHGDPQAAQKMQEELDFRESGQERRYSWSYDETFDLYERVKSTGELRQLTTATGYDAEGSYSPDGSKIAFASTRHAYSDYLSPAEQDLLALNPSYFSEIYIMDADGSNVQRLTDVDGYDGGPFFSPDGERIVWRRFDKEGLLADIYTMALDGSDVQRVTDFDSMSWAPFYHPSGDYIIFATNKMGFQNFELYMVDAAGTKEPVRVTFTDKFDGLPVFTPDGNSLAWTSSRHTEFPGQGAQIFMGDWDDSAARRALELAPERGAVIDDGTETEF